MSEIKNIDELVNNLTSDLISIPGEQSEALLGGIISFELQLPFNYKIGNVLYSKVVSFFECHFYSPVKLINIPQNIYFEDCVFYSKVDAFNGIFDGKVRFKNCEFRGKTIFLNAKFNNLADFYNSTFYQPTTFYKTDFNDTAVFTSVRFKENVLFTYSLFAGKSIFARTKFEKGFDFSQSIIAGQLQLFDLDIDFKGYMAEYVGNDDQQFQDNVHFLHKIPLINKVTTFQILKNQFAKQGNHIDEITMRQQEKKAFLELTLERKKDKNWTKSTRVDQFILWLNRWSNNYRSDFRNGISFTVIVAAGFLLLTFLTTGEFWNRLCLSCEFDLTVIGYSIKQFINFLNPAHNISYIDSLKPLFGIPYIIDFLGRIAVGYGYYQTVQAFRKFR